MKHDTQSPDIARGNWWELTTTDAHLHHFRWGILHGVVATVLQICRQEEELFKMIEVVSESETAFDTDRLYIYQSQTIYVLVYRTRTSFTKPYIEVHTESGVQDCMHSSRAHEHKTQQGPTQQSLHCEYAWQWIQYSLSTHVVWLLRVAKIMHSAICAPTLKVQGRMLYQRLVNVTQFASMLSICKQAVVFASMLWIRKHVC